MKTKFFLFFLILSFLLACGSDETENESEDAGNEGSTKSSNSELPDITVEEPDEEETPDDENESKVTCYSGGAIIAEGGQQFTVCAEDPEKFQKQICQNTTKWTNDGNCVSGTVTIPGGSFKMGCDKESEGSCPEDAVPAHDVEISSYEMDKFEVPVELFEKCIAENVCTNSNPDEPHYRTSSDSPSCNIGNPDRKNHPANCVTWYGAKAYCEWLGKRLPTEAEWEYAAKSGKTQLYPWGDSPEASCDNTVMKSSANGCGTNTTSPIGSKPAGISAHGVFDLSGNIAEYTNDWYEKKFYSTDEAKQKDTQGPAEPEKEDNKYKVIRGGSYIYGENRTRASFRSSAKLDNTAIDFGFRCVSSPK